MHNKRLLILSLIDVAKIINAAELVTIQSNDQKDQHRTLA